NGANASRHSPSVGASAQASKRIPSYILYAKNRTSWAGCLQRLKDQKKTTSGVEEGGMMHFPAPFSRPLIRAAVVAVVTVGATDVARAEIRIAVAGPLSVSPMTAHYAMFGEELRRGAELAVRDVNESGGINGQKLTLVIADDAGCDPKMAVEVANELAR